MNITDDYVLNNVEKYYVINMIIGVFNKKATKTLLMKIAGSVNSKGEKSLNELISKTIDHIKSKDIDTDQVIESIMPSIMFFFNDTSKEIRKRCFNIGTLPD